MANDPIGFYLDSNAVIGLVESRSSGYELLVALSADGSIRLHASELVLAEVLVKPLQLRKPALVELYEEALSPGGVIDVIVVARDILVSSAHNRAEFGNKGVDAIHIATALSVDCKIFVSGDKRIRMPAGVQRWDLDETLAWAAAR